MFCEEVENGKEVWAVFCDDINKAFDRVWHKGLLHKLHGICCSEKFLAWFYSYLSGRRQRVIFNSKFSKWVEVLAGVLQGYLLGPHLFLIYMYIKEIEAATILNTDLQNILHWANDWLVLFNANKTLSMLFSRKPNPT